MHNSENKSIIAPATIAKMIYSQRDLITTLSELGRLGQNKTSDGLTRHGKKYRDL